MPSDPENPPDSQPDDITKQDLAGLAAHPHDHFFKRVFQTPELSVEFFKAHLPEEIQRDLQWETLCCEATSFIHDDLKDSSSDLLFSVSAGEKNIQLYLLWEHQSTVVSHMPLRLLSYMVKIWERSFAANGLPLPVVIPFVLHQGPDKWTVDTEFLSLFELPGGSAAPWAKYLPNFTHLLTDLSQRKLTDEPLNPALQAILYLMQSVRLGRQVIDFFDWLARNDTVLFEMPAGLEKILILYALHGEERLDPQEIYLKLQHNKRIKADTMSTAQYLINQGLEKGLEQGMEKGKLTGRIQLLQQFLGLEVVPEEKLQLLDVSELKTQFESLEAAYNLKFKDR